MEERSERLTLRTLFGDPLEYGPCLAGDRALAAWFTTIDGAKAIQIQDVGRKNSATVLRIPPGSPFFLTWSRDSRHLLYTADVDGMEHYHVFRVDLSGEVMDLTPTTSATNLLIRLSETNPHLAVIASNRRDSRFFDLYLTPIDGSPARLLAQNESAITEYFVDQWLVPRAVVRQASPRKVAIRAGSHGDINHWREGIELAPADFLTTQVVGLTPDGRHLFVVRRDLDDTTRLVAYETNTWHEQLLYESRNFDIEAVLLDSASGFPDAIGLSGLRRRWVGLTDRSKSALEFIASIHPGDFSVIDRTSNSRLWLIEFSWDRGSNAYYVVDVVSFSVVPLFTARPKLDQLSSILSPMEPVEVPTRDGFRLACYLTRPQRPARTPPPGVVCIHGGPWSRDRWGYSPEAQWIAARGGACIQVNYRGSTGFGRRLLDAGDGQWGLEIQRDLECAARWMVEHGYADPSSIAAIGWSFGGYASLMSLVTSPDLFKCACAAVPLVDLGGFLEHLPAMWTPLGSVFEHRVSALYDGEKALRAASPIFRTQDIHGAVLVARADRDIRANPRRIAAFCAKLRKEHKKVRSIRIMKEGHSIRNWTNRVRFYVEAERFLSDEIGLRRT